MVLEALINPILAEKTPYKVLLLGILYSSIGIFLAIWIFKDQASLIMVFLTVMAVLPLVYSTFKLEEYKDAHQSGEMHLLKEHSKALTLLIFLFIGFVISFSTWYVLFPTELTSIVFKAQSQTIASINNKILGSAVQFDTLLKIFFNNLRVLIFCFLFSLIYGTGAIFILTWNASVIGAAIGNFIESALSHYTQKFGALTTATYFSAISLSIVRYFTHGIPEMASYFIAGLAGGLFSIALIKKHYFTEKFPQIMFDISGLVTISILLLGIAAAIEVYVTPLFF